MWSGTRSEAKMCDASGRFCAIDESKTTPKSPKGLSIKLALFGGSFDPFHAGHEAVVEEAMKTLSPDLLILMPAFQNPLKTHLPTSTNRLETLQRHYANNPKIVVSDFELARKSPSYTIDTVRHLIAQYRPEHFYLIIGADNLVTLEQWHEIKTLKSLCEIVVATRNQIAFSGYLRLDIDVPISSTELRQSANTKA